MREKKNYLQTKNILRSLYSKGKLEYKDKMDTYNTYIAQIRQLAYNGNIEAQYDLAQHYEDFNILGNPNPQANIKKKMYWYSKAAYNGHPAANNNLADMYERGEGCEKNLTKALELYKTASDLGDYLGGDNYKLLLKQIKEGKYTL